MAADHAGLRVAGPVCFAAARAAGAKPLADCGRRHAGHGSVATRAAGALGHAGWYGRRAVCQRYARPPSGSRHESATKPCVLGGVGLRGGHICHAPVAHALAQQGWGRSPVAGLAPRTGGSGASGHWCADRGFALATGGRGPAAGANLRILAAIAAIVLVRRCTGGTALPTLAGVLLFGLLRYLATL